MEHPLLSIHRVFNALTPVNLMSLLDKWAGRVSGFLDDVLLSEDLHMGLLQARRALDEERFEHALSLLQEIDARRPNLARVHELQGRALIGLQRFAEAASQLKLASSLRPHPRTLRLLAQALEEGQDHRAARETLRRALKLQPEPVEQLRLLHASAQLHLSIQRPDKALREMRKANRLLHDLPPDSLTTHERALIVTTLAQTLLARSEYTQAREALESILPPSIHTHPPTFSDSIPLTPLALYGRVLLKQNYPSHALACLLEAHRRLSSPDPLLLITAARAALHPVHKHHHLQTAQTLLTQASSLPNSTHSTQALTLLAETHLLQNNSAQALSFLAQAIQNEPNNPDVLRIRAASILQRITHTTPLKDDDLQRLEQAESALRTLRDLQPDNPAAPHGLAQCRTLRNDPTSARRLLEHARTLAPHDPSILHDLTIAIAQSESTTRAISQLRDLHTQAPSEEVAQFIQKESEKLYNKLLPSTQLPPSSNRDVPTILHATQHVQDWILQYPRLHHLTPQIQSILTTLDAPLDIAFVGEFNAGKSTLVNAFIGESVVPTGVLPTTAHVNVMRFGPRRVAQLHNTDNTISEVDFPDVKSIVKQREHDIDHIDYLYPHPDLRRVHIWDTPGFNSPNPTHEHHAKRALERAEVIFWICDASQAISDSQLQHIQTIRDPHERLVILLNKIDRLGAPGPEREEALEDICAHIHAALENKLKAIFPIAGRQALKALTKLPTDSQEQQQALEDARLPQLLAFAHEDIFDRASRLKAIVAHHALVDLASDIHTTGHELHAQHVRTSHAFQTLTHAWIERARPAWQRLLAHETTRLQDSLDFLLTLIERELQDAAQPSSRLLNSLFPRAELDPEDIRFVLELLLERFQDLLLKSQERLLTGILTHEQHLVELFDDFSNTLPPRDARRLHSHLDTWLEHNQTHRTALTQHLYAHYNSLVQGRVSAPGLEHIFLQNLSTQAPQEHNTRSALQDLLPPLSQEILPKLRAWLHTYTEPFHAFVQAVNAELQAVALEAQTFTRAFPLPKASQNPTSTPQDIDPPPSDPYPPST